MKEFVSCGLLFCYDIMAIVIFCATIVTIIVYLLTLRKIGLLEKLILLFYDSLVEIVAQADRL